MTVELRCEQAVDDAQKLPEMFDDLFHDTTFQLTGLKEILTYMCLNVSTIIDHLPALLLNCQAKMCPELLPSRTNHRRCFQNLQLLQHNLEASPSKLSIE